MQSFKLATTLTRSSVIGWRYASTTPQPKAEVHKPKLVFRFKPRDVPLELWPLGFVLVAGLTGGAVAISRHFMKDNDIQLQRHVKNTPGITFSEKH